MAASKLIIMLDAKYVLRQETPAADEYRRLRVLAGLSPKSAEGAAIGLPNTYFAVTIRFDGLLVGMGRVVGDGGLTFQVVDIAVDPEHQGCGLGKAVVSCLMEHLQTSAPVGAHIRLLADGPAEHLYRKFGFELTAPESVGMALPIR